MAIVLKWLPNLQKILRIMKINESMTTSTLKQESNSLNIKFSKKNKIVFDVRICNYDYSIMVCK